MKMERNLPIIFFILLKALALLIFTACNNDVFDPSLSSDNNIILFSFIASNNTALSSDVTGIVSGTDIRLNVPLGTVVSELIATFVTTGESVTANGITQTSDVTPNNFAVSVIYTVTAEDGSTQEYTVTVSGMNLMVSVPANTDGFDMGHSGVTNATPVHTVASISAFTMGIYEVTYRLWYDVKVWAELHGYSFDEDGREGHDGTDGDPPTSAENEPVTSVSWRNCIAWCNALSEKEGLTPCYYTDSSKTTVYKDSVMGGDISNDCVDWEADGYRLPTEAEWEYAARYIDGNSFLRGDAPSGWVDSNGDGEWRIEVGGSIGFEDDPEDDYSEVNAVAWWDSDSTHDVGQKQPNFLGIYDMSGNVWEWCWDWYSDYTNSSPYTDADTKGPDIGLDPIRRGASWNHDGASYMGTSYRTHIISSIALFSLGFRLVKKP